MGVLEDTGTTKFSGAPEFTPGFFMEPYSWYCSSFQFYVLCCFFSSIVFFMCLVSIVMCVGSLWYLFCLLHVSCVYCCVCRFSLILCCLLHVSCVYCCVCRFSLIFILSSSCVLCLLLCVLVLSDIYFVFFMCLVSIVLCVGSLWYLFIDNELIWILSTFITYHRICNKRNTTGNTWGTGITYPPGAPEFNLRF
jgi:hypothetical protein